MELMTAYGGEALANNICCLLFISNISSHMAHVKNFGKDNLL